MGKQNNQQSSGPPFNLVSAKQKASLSPAQTEVSGDHCAVWRELRVLYLGKGRGEEGRGGAEPGIAQERQVARHAWASLFELPLLATHGAVLLHLLCVQPLEDAVHMEAVGALSPHEGAVITRHLTVWTAAIKCHPADAAVLIVGYPEPSGHTIPTLNFHFHDRRACDPRSYSWGEDASSSGDRAFEQTQANRTHGPTGTPAIAPCGGTRDAGRAHCEAPGRRPRVFRPPRVAPAGPAPCSLSHLRRLIARRPALPLTPRGKV